MLRMPGSPDACNCRVALCNGGPGNRRSTFMLQNCRTGAGTDSNDRGPGLTAGTGNQE